MFIRAFRRALEKKREQRFLTWVSKYGLEKTEGDGGAPLSKGEKSICKNPDTDKKRGIAHSNSKV